MSPQLDVRMVPLSEIVQPRAPDRLDPGDEAIQELAASIAQHSLLQPIILTTNPDGPGFLLVAGQRRVIACASLGWSEIPATILNLRGSSPELLRLTENLQRLDLSPIEEAHALHRWRQKEGLTQEQAAEAMHVGLSWLKKREALLRLPDELITALHSSEVSPSVALELARIDDPAIRSYYLDTAKSFGATQDVAAAWVNSYKAQGASPSTTPVVDATAAYAANPGGHRLGCHACRRTFPIAKLQNVFLCPDDLEAIAGATAQVQKGP